MSSLERAISIPIRNTDDVVVVKVSDLGETDVNDLLELLMAELAPLEVWHDFAVEYYRQGNVDSFLAILESGTDKEIDRVYPGEENFKGRISILNTLAAYYTQAAVREKDKTEKDQLFGRAASFYTMSDKIDIHEQSTWVGKGTFRVRRGPGERGCGRAEGEPLWRARNASRASFLPRPRR